MSEPSPSSLLAEVLQKRLPDSGEADPFLLTQLYTEWCAALMAVPLARSVAVLTGSPVREGAAWTHKLLRSRMGSLRAVLDLDLLSAGEAEAACLAAEAWWNPATTPTEAYEAVLGLDFEIVDGVVHAATNTHLRKGLGAFYTPMPLAEACVDRVLNDLGDSADGAITVMDWSCGPGRFLVAYLRTLRQRLGTDRGAPKVLADSARLLRGVDVDPIALACARVEVAREAGDPDLLAAGALSLTLANPLLLTDTPDEHADRLTAARRGEFNSPQMAIAEAEGRARYDVVLGNPPWERIRLEERAFFRRFAHEVSNEPRKDRRARLIDAMSVRQPALHAWHQQHRVQMDSASARIRADDRFASSARGELNTYALFTELAMKSVTRKGAVGLLVKSALFTSRAHAALFARLRSEGSLVIQDFVNTARLFRIDSRERFALLRWRPSAPAGLRFAMGLTQPHELAREAELLFEINPATLERLSPLTGTLPNTSNPEELSLLLHTAQRFPLLDEVVPHARYGRLLHLTAHALYIHRAPARDRLPVLEGKLFEQYDGRYATFTGVPHAARYTAKASARQTGAKERADPATVPVSRFHVEGQFWAQISAQYTASYSLYWRNTSSATNRRTMIATILPHQPSIQSVQLLQLTDDEAPLLGLLLAIFNSLPFDLLVRRRLNGIDVTAVIVRQTPLPSMDDLDLPARIGSESGPVRDLILARVAALLSEDARLARFVHDLRVPPAKGERRRLMREIDGLVALAYGTSPRELRQILAAFPRDVPPAEHAWTHAVQAVKD